MPDFTLSGACGPRSNRFRGPSRTRCGARTGDHPACAGHSLLGQAPRDRVFRIADIDRELMADAVTAANFRRVVMDELAIPEPDIRAVPLSPIAPAADPDLFVVGCPLEKRVVCSMDRDERPRPF